MADKKPGSSGKGGAGDAGGKQQDNRDSSKPVQVNPGFKGGGGSKGGGGGKK